MVLQTLILKKKKCFKKINKLELNQTKLAIFYLDSNQANTILFKLYIRLFQTFKKYLDKIMIENTKKVLYSL